MISFGLCIDHVLYGTIKIRIIITKSLMQKFFFFFLHTAHILMCIKPCVHRKCYIVYCNIIEKCRCINAFPVFYSFFFFHWFKIQALQHITQMLYWTACRLYAFLFFGHNAFWCVSSINSNVKPQTTVGHCVAMLLNYLDRPSDLLSL